MYRKTFFAYLPKKNTFAGRLRVSRTPQRGLLIGAGFPDLLVEKSPTGQATSKSCQTNIYVDYINLFAARVFLYFCAALYPPAAGIGFM